MNSYRCGTRRQRKLERRSSSRVITVAFVLASLLSTFAAAQTIGTNICACQPSVYNITLNFGLNCSNFNVAGPGIEQTTCLIGLRGSENQKDADLIPVQVNAISVFELDQTLDVAAQTNYAGSYLDGQSFTYTSVIIADANIQNASQLPRGFQIVFSGINKEEQALVNYYTILYKNDCGIFPLLQIGELAGWGNFTYLGDPPAKLCPLAAQGKTTSPTFSPSVASMSPSLSTVFPTSRMVTGSPTRTTEKPTPSATDNPTPLARPPSTDAPSIEPPSTVPPSIVPQTVEPQSLEPQSIEPSTESPAPSTYPPHCIPKKKSKPGKVSGTMDKLPEDSGKGNGKGWSAKSSKSSKAKSKSSKAKKGKSKSNKATTGKGKGKGNFETSMMGGKGSSDMMMEGGKSSGSSMMGTMMGGSSDIGKGKGTSTDDETYAPETYSPETYAPETFSPSGKGGKGQGGKGGKSKGKGNSSDGMMMSGGKGLSNQDGGKGGSGMRGTGVDSYTEKKKTSSKSGSGIMEKITDSKHIVSSGILRKLSSVSSSEIEIRKKHYYGEGSKMSKVSKSKSKMSKSKSKTSKSKSKYSKNSKNGKEPSTEPTFVPTAECPEYPIGKGKGKGGKGTGGKGGDGMMGGKGKGSSSKSKRGKSKAKKGKSKTSKAKSGKGKGESMMTGGGKGSSMEGKGKGGDGMMEGNGKGSSTTEGKGSSISGMMMGGILDNGKGKGTSGEDQSFAPETHYPETYVPDTFSPSEIGGKGGGTSGGMSGGMQGKGKREPIDESFPGTSSPSMSMLKTMMGGKGVGARNDVTRPPTQDNRSGWMSSITSSPSPNVVVKATKAPMTLGGPDIFKGSTMKKPPIRTFRLKR